MPLHYKNYILNDCNMIESYLSVLAYCLKAQRNVVQRNKSVTVCCVIQHDNELCEDVFARRDVEWQRDDELCEVVFQRRGVVWSCVLCKLVLTQRGEEIVLARRWVVWTSGSAGCEELCKGDVMMWNMATTICVNVR